MTDFSAYLDPALPSPCYVVDEDLLVRNLKILQTVKERSGCKILLAQKAFSLYRLYPLIGRYLDGTTASSLFEARLGREEMGGQTHIYAPAYREDEFGEILSLCDHIVFNTPAQVRRFAAQAAGCGRAVSLGLRINPEYSEVGTELYNPCAPFSRMGTTFENFDEREMGQIEGLHFHTLCEQNADALVHTLQAAEEKFGRYFGQMKWLNFGGGHHITRPDYDIDALVGAIRRIREQYGVEVYLEPGEAVALDTGFLACTVLDTMHNGMDIAILDTTAACHMPDVLEMPYRPPLFGAKEPGALPYTYRLGGPTCLAGDIIGTYSFEHPLSPGDRLVFGDMAHYTMVKNNTFNGIRLPAIALYSKSEGLRVHKTFGYQDFKERL